MDRIFITASLTIIVAMVWITVHLDTIGTAILDWIFQ
jgi:hypothetical protein